MKRLVEFLLEDGSTMLVEVDEPEPEGGVVKAARPGELITRSQQTFDQALEKVKPAASLVIQKLRALSDPPDEIDVEFGLKLSAESGAFIAAAGIEANYRVTLKWKKQSQAA
ncbi:MAG: hypothetical protein A2W35_15230 [Chloroflexi bacterium RBG_16_57_11]|nr:MAG: hypothetical protein A2W35_15230 [Chloroflexi bacterium RBG_16_57_11]